MSYWIRDGINAGLATVFVIAFATVLAAVLFGGRAAAVGNFSVTRDVPSGATLELRVGGRVVESVPIDAGTYSITVRRSK